MLKSRTIHASLAALAVTALAFFLRVYRLGDKNVWWDEGWTVWMAQHDFAWIALRTASDEHPPLHYWLMNVWQMVFGADVFTGRFLSLAFGVLLIALVYRIGKEMGGARLGVLAALFLSFARFNVWWAQDIKNYTLSAYFAWASVWFTWKLIENGSSNSRRTWLYVFGYALAAALSLYSHYLGALIVLASNVFVGMVLLVRWRRGEPFVPLLLRWIAAQIAALVLFVPWLIVYLQNGATWSAAPAFDFGLFLQLAATVLTLGVTTFIENYTWIVLGLLLIAASSIGWLVPESRFAPVIPPTPEIKRGLAELRTSVVASRAEANPRSLAWATVYMLLIALVPPALIYILSLTPAAIFAPKIQARYLMMLTPAVAMLLALGVLFIGSTFRARAAQLVTAALVLVILAAQIFTLTDYFRDRYLRDEYQTVAQMINNFGFAQDALVLNTDQEYPTFLYYLEHPMDWIGVPNGAPVTEAIAQRVAATAAQKRAVWVVTIPDALERDPNGLVEQKIAERLPKLYEQTFGDKRLALYTAETRNVKDVPRENFVPLQVRNQDLDERLKLVGVDLPVREALPGDVIRVVTYWQAHDLTTVNLALQKPDGEIVARASVPLSVGAHERAQGDLQIPPDAVVGELQVVAQARLNSTLLGSVRVLPRDTPGSTINDAVMQPRSEGFGKQIQLVGVSVPTQKFRAGETVPLTLFWQTDAPIPTSYTVFVHLLGTQNNPSQNNFLWGQVDRLPLDGKLPTTAWRPGQTIADPYRVQFQADAPRGVYQVEIGLYDATGTRLPLLDANGNAAGDALIVGQVEIGE